ncbi:MAG: hypothetical protein WCV55_03160 [Candidatus Paceibacterota bacterium]
MSTSQLQLDQQRVTQDLLKNSGTIRFIKNQTFGKIPMYKSQSSLLTELGWNIVKIGIETEKLETEILMMALMAVNHIAKYEKLTKQVRSRKNELQAILYKRDNVSKTEGERRYFGTIELRYRIWTSHIPSKILKKILRNPTSR